MSKYTQKTFKIPHASYSISSTTTYFFPEKYSPSSRIFPYILNKQSRMTNAFEKNMKWWRWQRETIEEHDTRRIVRIALLLWHLHSCFCYTCNFNVCIHLKWSLSWFSFYILTWWCVCWKSKLWKGLFIYYVTFLEWEEVLRFFESSSKIKFLV